MERMLEMFKTEEAGDTIAFPLMVESNDALGLIDFIKILETGGMN